MKGALKPEHCTKPFRCTGADTVPIDIPSTCSEMLRQGSAGSCENYQRTQGKLKAATPVSISAHLRSSFSESVVVRISNGHESTRDPGSCCPGELQGHASDCSSIGPPAEQNTKAGQSCVSSMLLRWKIAGCRESALALPCIAKAHKRRHCDKTGHRNRVSCPD